MRSLPRGVICKLGIISTLWLAQACGQGPKNKKIISSDASQIDCKNDADHDKDGVPNRIDADCPISQTVLNAGRIATATKTTPAESLTPAWPLCASVSYNAPEKPANAVLERSPEKIARRNEVQQFNSQLLQEINQAGLTQEKAVQIALVNNPELFAYYENLELGYADLLEASLRQNPKYSGAIRFPNEPGKTLNKLFDMSINFLDNFLIPLRQRAAEAEISVIESQVGQKVIDLVEEVQIHWLEVKILELQLDKESKRVELKALAAELATLQWKAGNVSALNAITREIQYEQAKEKLKNLIAELEIAREKLNRSLGLFGNEACWKISGEIDWKNDLALPDIQSMELAAVENRPDIEAIRREIYAIAQKAKLKEPWTYTNLRVGVSAERQPEGFTTAGPAIELEMPVFNFGQGEMKKYNALIAQAQKLLLAKAIQACSEVREFLKTAELYQSQLKVFDLKILPDHAKQTAAGQTHYNVMTLGVYALFDFKDAETQAMMEKIQALKNYTKAKIELLHAVGGSFDVLGRKE